ncbi:glycosyltransferase [Halosimplex carlsbadense 2-9-1]|uniref:Glycosyltransferase n=2 Tax=Halosimplex carlsbadense TaxID=171164 RepID=M0CM41_9EURY|nr:glycosyltransferase [Halosimplex carlsbadense 2-9-1]
MIRSGVYKELRMKVSIITPVYNEPRIADTLESIFSQRDVPELEVIVIDGESTDKTTDILDEYQEKIDVLVRESDEGVYDAMNTGISLATGDIIGILNADDRYQHPDVLRTVVNTFNETETDICYGNLVYVNSDDSVVRYWKSGPYASQKFYFGWMPPHPTVFVRRGMYKKYGTFDLEFEIAADYEFLLRLLVEEAVPATYINEVLVRMSIGGQSNRSLSNIFNANVEVAKSWQKHNHRFGPLVGIIKPLRKITQYVKKP